MIEIISGTNRPRSNALKLSMILRRIYEEAGARVNILSLEEMPPEIFNPASYAKKPESFGAIQDRVLAAEGLHVVTPEYNGSFPGVLKYFIDMLKFPDSFEHKCVCFTGEAAGNWGAFRSVEQLQLIFGYRNAYVMPERVWLPDINNKLNEAGTEIIDEALRKHVEAQCRSFFGFTKHHLGGKSALRDTQS